MDFANFMAVTAFFYLKVACDKIVLNVKYYIIDKM